MTTRLRLSPRFGKRLRPRPRQRAAVVMLPPGRAERSRWTVTIPRWHPTKLNDLVSAHWGKRSRMKLADLQTVAAACLDAGVRMALGRRRVALTIVLGKGQRAGDPDAYHKSLNDALVRCGALRDDSRTWCELAPVQFERAAQKSARIELTDLG